MARTEAVPALPSEEDIDWIQQLAELHKLEVVPLVQTFGHVEVGAGSIFGGEQDGDTERRRGAVSPAPGLEMDASLGPCH